MIDLCELLDILTESLLRLIHSIGDRELFPLLLLPTPIFKALSDLET